ncbi:hypothetical protein [Streptomyces sp. NPDC017991]|uniref:hypothetical protein n=1 Tax=Streptomyces sp. NPDC017991 TaxID=3365026 RepID=UPI00379BEBF9
MATVTQPRKTLVFGIVALVAFAVIATTAAIWWKQHNKLSQASKADCQLAQDLIDSAQQIPKDEAGIEKWVKAERKLRAQLHDGYLGANISAYNGWAAQRAKGEGKPPQKQIRRVADSANDHCADADVKLTFPSLSA